MTLEDCLGQWRTLVRQASALHPAQRPPLPPPPRPPTPLPPTDADEASAPGALVVLPPEPRSSTPACLGHAQTFGSRRGPRGVWSLGGRTAVARRPRRLRRGDGVAGAREPPFDDGARARACHRNGTAPQGLVAPRLALRGGVWTALPARSGHRAMGPSVVGRRWAGRSASTELQQLPCNVYETDIQGPRRPRGRRLCDRVPRGECAAFATRWVSSSGAGSGAGRARTPRPRSPSARGGFGRTRLLPDALASGAGGRPPAARPGPRPGRWSACTCASGPRTTSRRWARWRGRTGCARASWRAARCASAGRLAAFREAMALHSPTTVSWPPTRSRRQGVCVNRLRRPDARGPGTARDRGLLPERPDVVAETHGGCRAPSPTGGPRARVGRDARYDGLDVCLARGVGAGVEIDHLEFLTATVLPVGSWSKRRDALGPCAGRRPASLVLGGHAGLAGTTRHTYCLALLQQCFEHLGTPDSLVKQRTALEPYPQNGTSGGPTARIPARAPVRYSNLGTTGRSRPFSTGTLQYHAQ